MQIEEWREIKSIPGYFVSSMGRIKSKRGIYKSSVTKQGYHIIRIPCRNYVRPLHRVIAELFIGKSDLQVNHKDGDKSNNSISNLEYLSCRDNIRHAIKIGLRSATQNLKSNALFDQLQLKVIRHCLLAGFENTIIARYFGCHHSTISKIRTGVNYAK